MASILYAAGKLGSTSSFVAGRTVHGAAWAGGKILEGGITVIGTPINIATGGKVMGLPTHV